jgi:hypothetical protein
VTQLEVAQITIFGIMADYNYSLRLKYEQVCKDCGESDFIEDHAAGDLICRVGTVACAQGSVLFFCSSYKRMCIVLRTYHTTEQPASTNYMFAELRTRCRVAHHRRAFGVADIRRQR